MVGPVASPGLTVPSLVVAQSRIKAALPESKLLLPVAAEIMPAELADDFRLRAHAIVRTWLRGEVESLVALVGDDADSCCRPGTR